MSDTKTSVRPGRRVAEQAALAGWIMLMAGGAVAQTAPSPGAVLQQTAPVTSTPSVPGTVFSLPAPAAQARDNSVQIPVSHLVIDGATLLSPESLHTAVASAEGQSLTLDQLNALVSRIGEAYHAAGYPVAFAYLPAQTVANGVIHIAVVEPRYDRVTATGTSRLDAARTVGTMGVKVGDPVAQAPLERGLLLLQETPGVQVRGVLVAGGSPGTSALELERTDLPVLSGMVSLDNHGNRYTGKVLGRIDVAANDPFGQGSSLGANALSSTTGGMTAAGLRASSPDLGNGLRLGAYASATHYTLGEDFANLDESGTSTQAGLSLSYPLVLQTGKRLDLRFDLSRNRSTQTVGATDTWSRQNITLGQITLSGAASGQGGAVTSGRVALSFGDLAISPDAALTADAAGLNTAGRFQTLRFLLSRTQPLGTALTFSADLSGQIATRNLDSSQKFYLGGPDAVMSVAVGDGGGDAGALLRLRLERAFAHPGTGTLSGALIAQAGEVWVDHTPASGSTDPNRQSAGAVGVALDYAQGPWQFNAAVVAAVGAQNLDAGTQLWLGAQMTF
ncbi:POTRA domain-containing protein [Limimaricola sp.]|uniref:ShlB/FhaC/HecB family hemolysin secretion/activation protein n=1 Tax=Limimaricola sp. TaxID=2211665 RepID=UPI0025BB40F4|nr:POTRA domain-containing protein [Limimaricola sp.]